MISDSSDEEATEPTSKCRKKITSLENVLPLSNRRDGQKLRRMRTLDRPPRSHSAPTPNDVKSDVDKISLISLEIEKILPNHGTLFKDLMLTYYYH